MTLNLLLQGNGTGPAGGTAFAECLKTNTALHTLNLQGNDIQSDGASVLKSVLGTKNKTLMALDISDNGVDDLIEMEVNKRVAAMAEGVLARPWAPGDDANSPGQEVSM